MARDYPTQHLAIENGYAVDYGQVEFTTTGSTVEIYTPLSKVLFYEIQPLQALTIVEQFYINETVTGVGDTYTNCGFIDSSGLTSLTLTRATTPLYFMGVASTDYITSNNYVEVPIGVCPVAGTLNEAWYYNDVKNGGTPLINIGHVPTNGTGTADPDEFLANAKAEAAPANSVGKSITSFTATAVGADDLITFSTTGGASSDPQGGWCQVMITPTLTSGLKVAYKLIGID